MKEKDIPALPDLPFDNEWFESAYERLNPQQLIDLYEFVEIFERQADEPGRDSVESYFSNKRLKVAQFLLTKVGFEGKQS